MFIHSCFYLIKQWVIFNFNEGGFFSEKYTISVLNRCISLFFFECNLLNIMAINQARTFVINICPSKGRC
ncbi:hypothetical protein EI038_27060 [Escherichia coli]|nr:hypothetical protein [Escherichia coli]